MAKRFKLRISRVFPSFHSCRSKDLPENPLPPIFRISTVNHNTPSTFDFPAPPPPTPPSSIRHHVSSAIVSVGCGCRDKTDGPSPIATPDHSDFQWRKEDKWHVVARISNHHQRSHIFSGDSSDDVFPSENAVTRRKKLRNKSKKNKNRKKKVRSRVRNSTSSADHSGWFSSDEHERGEDDRNDDEYDDDDTETLMSSRTFSDDSTPEFSPSLETIQERKPRRGGRVKTVRKKRSPEVACPSPETDVPARVSVFAGRRLAEGKVRESFAVVKRSEDPYGDFKRSMVEMILEKEMYEAGDLEQLLRCFLSLNSQAHHGVIVDAFSDIWKALFSSNSRLSKAAALSSLL